MKKGKGHHQVDFTDYEVGNNSIFFMRPGQVHKLTLKAGSTGFLVEFKTDFYHPHDKTAHQLLRKASNKNFCLPQPDNLKKLLFVLDYMQREYTDKREGYREVIKANLGIFFIELVRQRRNSPKSSESVNPYQQERLEEFSALLETHFSTHKQVSEYAAMLHITPYQLNAITKATLGKTCSALISEYVVLEAKRHLLATAQQVNQVADYLGYEDVSYFIRFFKKHTGYSPEAFRNNYA